MNNFSTTYIYSIVIILFALSVLIFHAIQLHYFSTVVVAGDISERDSLATYTTKQDNKKDTVATTVLFLGDVMLGRNVEFLSDSNGVEYSTASIATELPATDAVVANFESAMASPHRRTRAYTTQFSTASTMLPALLALGVTHASLANNHALDFGVTGYNHTITELSQIGITPFGHPDTIGTSSVTILDGPQRIGMIGINTVFSVPDVEQLRLQVAELQTSTDVQVAYIHWGDEYIPVHNQAQENFARELVAMGIDVIIGHHPHVVQDIDIIDGVLVFYSLGNFIFDQYFSTAVQEGYAVHMLVEADRELSFTIIPITSVDTRSQPRKMNDEETIVFLTTLAEQSNPVIRDQIMQNNLRTVNLAPNF